MILFFISEILYFLKSFLNLKYFIKIKFFKGGPAVIFAACSRYVTGSAYAPASSLLSGGRQGAFHIATANLPEPCSGYNNLYDLCMELDF